QYIQDNVDEAVAGAKGALAVKIYGPDIDELQRIGDQITSVVSKIPGLVDVANTQQLGQPQYQVQIDRDEASRYGVNVSDVQNVVETAIGGKIATRLVDGEKRFPVSVRFSKEYRNNIKALDNILIDPPGPISSVPLSEMGSIKYATGAAVITREANSRVMYVRINLRGRDLGSAVLEAQKAIKDNVKIPEGYTLKWAGQYEFQQQANQRLMVIVPATFVLIFLILLAAFGSYKNALIIMCGVPLAALGGISALLITGTYFSISAAVGFIALSGVAVQNGVILISHINMLRKEKLLSIKEAAFQGAVDRMRPVLMTATVAMLGLLPAAMSNGIGAQSQKPFAIAIIGGLLSATFLTLIVLPVIYSVVERDKKKDPDMPKPDAVLAQGLLPFLVIGISIAALSSCTSPDGKNLSVASVATAFSPKEAPADKSKKSAPSSSDTVMLDENQQKEIGLEIATAHEGLIYKSVDATGRVGPNAELSNQVSTPSPGRAVEVRAKLGETVHEGDIMAVIKSDPIGQVQSDLLQSSLQSKADIKQQEVQLKLSRITFERETTLWNEQVSAKADLQAAENQLEKDEANLAALKSKLDATITTAQERLTLLGAPANSAKKVLAERKLDPFVVIRAPRTGLIIDRSINPGDMNDGNKPLFTLADLSEVWLFADIFEKDIADVKKGQGAVVSLDSLAGKSFPAKIIWVGDSISAQTRTLPVRANVANNDFHLKPGMFARMKVDVGQKQVISIPKSAVLEKGDRDFVFIEVKPGTYEQREVSTGVSDSKNIEIVGGIKEGDKVVSQGAIALLGASLKATAGDN
ncbi:MAG: efflux RND transporter periplasmic adaptor subunit, partial [Candidatus Obscuribacterales bacterium]|nr:efflux RND transporter periplasmic adaptor subunit [Candidatus Obscuribacterales bacterium]